MPFVEVCLSPALVPLHTLSDKIVVVTDILRATSCMVTALAHGVARIRPVRSVEECRDWQAKGFLAAAERDGQQVAGFGLANSPFSYQNPALQGKEIVVSTTNGTQAIKSATEAAEVLIGAFLNLQSIADYLLAQQRDVLLLCSAWKNRPSLEDSLFAGALVAALQPAYQVQDDAALMSARLYQEAAPKLLATVQQGSHVQRLYKLGIEADIAFCLQHNVYEVLPALRGDCIEKI